MIKTLGLHYYTTALLYYFIPYTIKFNIFYPMKQDKEGVLSSFILYLKVRFPTQRKQKIQSLYLQHEFRCEIFSKNKYLLKVSLYLVSYFYMCAYLWTEMVILYIYIVKNIYNNTRIVSIEIWLYSTLVITATQKKQKKDAKTVSICLDECQDITLINQSF